MPKKETPIYGSVATIYTNDFEVWQFRTWISGEKQYVRKSLRTKVKSEAIAKAEEFIKIKARQSNGEKLFGLMIKEAVEEFLNHKRSQIGRKIVEDRYKMIETHLTHFLNYVGRKTNSQNLTRKCLVNYAVEGEESNYATYRFDQGAMDQQ